MRPAESRRALRAVLPAAPPRLDDDRRRARSRAIWKSHRRGRDLDEAHERACRRRTWAASASRSRPPIPTSSTRSIEAANKAGGIFRSAEPAARPGRSAPSTSPMRHGSTTRTLRRSRRTPTASTSMDIVHPGLRGRRQDLPPLGEKNKHVDNHAMWIDPEDTDHLLVGCDGGVYETDDRGAIVARSRRTCPMTQFYQSRWTTRPLLQRLRRHAGQLHPRRSVAHRQRSTGSRTATGSSRPGGDGFHSRRRSRGPEHRSIPRRSTGR